MEKTLRAYSKSELGSLYLPQVQPASAWRTLRTWIDKNKQLKQELEETGYTHRCIILTPMQVEIIFKYLGVP